MTFSVGNTTAANLLGQKLSEAQRLGRPLVLAELAFAGLVPESIEAGMVAQAATVQAIGREIAGWKVAINSERIPVAAPIVDLYSTGSHGRVEVAQAGAKAIELEICFRLTADIPAPSQGGHLTRDDLLTKIASIHVGAELLGYRIAEEDGVPFPLFVADRLGNHSFVLGAEIDRMLLDLIASQSESVGEVSLQDGSDILFNGRPKHPQRDPMSSLVAYANHPSDRLGGLRRGQLVTTGSLCGVVKIRPGSELVVHGVELEPMRISIPPSRPYGYQVV
jgi:2-keto-4-pentenoate hydratase